MPVQTGPRGYDPSLTIGEQIADLKQRLAEATPGSHQALNLQSRIAGLEAHIAGHKATEERSESELAAQGRRAGTVKPTTGYGRVPE